jgi:cell division septum initiation protein DivIVA
MQALTAAFRQARVLHAHQAVCRGFAAKAKQEKTTVQKVKEVLSDTQESIASKWETTKAVINEIAEPTIENAQQAEHAAKGAAAHSKEKVSGAVKDGSAKAKSMAEEAKAKARDITEDVKGAASEKCELFAILHAYPWVSLPFVTIHMLGLLRVDHLR